jgi:outer membrane receptor for ferrienterochelin and colicins
MLGLKAQELTVTAEQDGQIRPLPGAVVEFKALEGAEAGSVKVRITDEKGRAVCPFVHKSLYRAGSMGFAPVIDTLSGAERREVRLEPDGVRIDEIVVTGSYIADPAEKAVYRVKILDRARIETQAAVNLRDLLAQEVNLRVGEDFALGSQLSIMGLSGQYVKFLRDGVPVIGRLDGNIDLTQLNLSQIERVEIVEGPMSVIYGSDAVGGVINLISRRDASRPHLAGANLFYKSDGHYNADAYAGARWGKYGLRIHGGRNFFDGWSSNDTLFVRKSLWRPREQYFGGAELERNVKTLRFRWSSNVFRETLFNRGEPVVTSRYAIATDEQFVTLRFDNGIFAEGFVRPTHHLNVFVNHNEYRRERTLYIKDMTTLERKPSEEEGSMRTDGFSQSLSRGIYTHRSPDKSWGIQAGYEASYERGWGPRLKGGRVDMWDVAAFASMEWAVWSGRLTFRPGLRVAYNSRFRSLPVPTFNVRYAMSERSALRVSYGASFRAPGLKELFFDFQDASHDVQGNPNLKAESGHTVQAQYQWRFEQGKVRLTFEPAAFYNLIADKIELSQVAGGTPPPFRYLNVSRYQTAGGQVAVKFVHGPFSLETGASLTRKTLWVGEANLNTSFTAPDFRLAPAYRFEKIGLTPAVFYKYNGPAAGLFITRIHGVDRVEQSIVAAFHLLDVTMTQSFWNNRIHLTVGGRNLLNVTNVAVINGGGGTHTGASATAPTATGRTVFVGLRFEWR